MSILTFNLKKEYYLLTKKGKKTYECRPANDYWTSRITNLKGGDKIKFRLGYTKETIIAEVKRIHWGVHISHIPIKSDLKKIYGGKYQHYFIIEFKVDGV